MQTALVRIYHSTLCQGDCCLGWIAGHWCLGELNPATESDWTYTPNHNIKIISALAQNATLCVKLSCISKCCDCQLSLVWQNEELLLVNCFQSMSSCRWTLCVLPWGLAKEPADVLPATASQHRVDRECHLKTQVILMCYCRFDKLTVTFSCECLGSLFLFLFLSKINPLFVFQDVKSFSRFSAQVH